MTVERQDVNEEASGIPCVITGVGGGVSDPDLQVTDVVVVRLDCPLLVPDLLVEFTEAAGLDEIIDALTRARESVWGPR